MIRDSHTREGRPIIIREFDEKNVDPFAASDFTRTEN